MIDPTEDDLSYFADWYLNSGDIKRLYTPFKNPLLFIEGVSGVVLYRKDNFQVELFHLVSAYKLAQYLLVL